MFKDFHESTRNVGMMSMLLGFLVLVGFWGLGMAVYSGLGQKDRGPSLSSRIEQLEKSVEVTREEFLLEQGRLKKMEGFQKTLSEIAEMQNELANERSNIQKLRQQAVGLDEELVELGGEFEDYRDRYRSNERNLAKGEIIDLSETKGPDFKECKIIGISPLHLRVMRTAGPTGIPYQELPKDVQDRFQFEAEEAAGYAKALAARDAKTNQQIVAFRKKEGERKAMEAVEQRKERAKQLVLLVQQQKNLAAKLDRDAKTWETKAKGMDAKAAAAKARGQITSNPGHARQARAKSKRYKTQANEARAAAQKFQAELDQINALGEE